MRATISFEIDVDKVEETMSVLVEQQSHTLRLATNILENMGKPTLLEEVTEVLDLLGEATSQLQQYRQMLVSFERARFETILPQPSPAPNSVLPPELQDGLEKMKSSLGDIQQFDNFLDRISEEETDDAVSEEG